MTIEEATDCVLIINENLNGARLALLELHKRGGWRILGHKTWEACCREEFGYSRSYAYQIIQASRVATQLSAMADISAEELNERQARAMNAVPVEHRRAVIEQVLADGPITARAITEAAESITHGSGKPLIELDKIGRQIPAQILPLWKHADEAVESMMTKISAFKGQIREADEKDDVVYGEINISMLTATLSNVYADLKRVIPHVVCSTCNGFNSDRCVTCKGRGFLSKFYWDNCIPIETKAMLERGSRNSVTP